MVLPSDHHVGDEPAFLAALKIAVRSAERAITTIGITPTSAETGYGYIESGEEFADGVQSVVRFVEKPDKTRAEEYLAGGRHYWNSGMFFFRAAALLDAVRRHLPELHAGLERIERAAERGPDAERSETELVFPSLPSISIDYGIMERESPLHVVRASFGWSDLGSWQSAWELAPKDASGNAADPNALLVDARGNLVRDLRSGEKSRPIAVLGVNDLCVIETEDATLVVPRDRAQDVRMLVEALERRHKL